MPYGYYQFVRFAVFAGCGYLAYHSFAIGNKVMPFVYSAIALLFQPFVKIALGRLIWNVVDVALALFLIATIFLENNNLEEDKNH